MTAIERDWLAQNPKMYKGRLYGTRYYKHTKGDSSEVSGNKYLQEDEVFTYKDVDTLANDCLIHAINFALRFPHFTDREQVIRLAMKRLKKTMEEAQVVKAETGVAVEAFKDFFLFGRTVYSLAAITKVHTFKE